MSESRFDYFAPEAVNTLVVAQRHVVARGGQGLEPEHLLLAFLDPPGEQLREHLTTLGYAADRAVAVIDSQLPKHDPPYHGEIGLTLASKSAIEAAVDEARTQGAAWIDDRHVLLGILRQTDNPVLIALQGAGLDLLPLQDQLRALPPRTKGLRSADALLRASPRFVIVASSGLLALAAFALPLPAWTNMILVYLIVVSGGILITSLLKYAEAGDHYRRGGRGAQLRALHTLDPELTVTFFLGLLVPIVLFFVARQFFGD